MPGPETESSRTRELDETLLLTSLKDLVTAGEHRLDPMLAAIADAARRLTGATGAAIAMWKEGAIVCRARSGTTAPPLGARVNAEGGITGECLRTGKVQHCRDTENDPLVDVEVCRSLGLRSIAVLPIQGWRGINGILEVFSTVPATFAERHLAVLDQLAALAERARASQPHGASPVATSTPLEKPPASGLLPASDRVGDVALAFVEKRSRPLVMGVVGLAAIGLIGLVIWLGWRGPEESDGKAHAAAPVAAATTGASAAGHIPDSDPVWKPNPGGETLPLFGARPMGGKTSAGTPVKLASEVVRIPEKRADRSLLAGDAVAVAIPHSGEAVADAPAPAKPAYAEEAATEPPAISGGQSSASSLNEVLVAKATVPELRAPVSQGLAGGQLLRRVAPLYPAQARMARLEGRVILSAMVMEDGSVTDLRLVHGDATLAKSAMDAVKQWRYTPYLLNGRPVKRETMVTVDFKFPTER